MSKTPPGPKSSKREESIKRLIMDLRKIKSDIFAASSTDVEMLSMILDEVIKGVDIAERYPSFYQKLMQDAELRAMFLDTLESIEKDQQEELTALPIPGEVRLDFLNKVFLQPTVTELKNHSWQASWQRSIQQLQQIFSPPKLVYRSEPDLFDGPWFTLVQGEVEVGESSYEIRLECAPSTDGDDSFSISLTVTSEGLTDVVQYPIGATLAWGSYRESIILATPGKARFPDISMLGIFDDEKEKIRAGLNLTIETSL
jgi:hypothetical protein